ncbi:hypothetical protein [Luteimonas panaciterrae]|uniref:hypothetical protein n=1 Tax=Luteimonas panaciterrae TaxID=363885 RepID=UPI001CFA3C4F|nr:hypothetical protein [Luteimonas panaciterrae]
MRRIYTGLCEKRAVVKITGKNVFSKFLFFSILLTFSHGVLADDCSFLVSGSIQSAYFEPDPYNNYAEFNVKGHVEGTQRLMHYLIDLDHSDVNRANAELTLMLSAFTSTSSITFDCISENTGTVSSVLIGDN